MRRSAAPSQMNTVNAKRPKSKFAPPASSRLCSTQTSHNYSHVSTAASGNLSPVGLHFENETHSCSFPIQSSVSVTGTAGQAQTTDKENKDKGDHSHTPLSAGLLIDSQDRTKNGSNNNKQNLLMMKSSSFCDSTFRALNYNNTSRSRSNNATDNVNR